MNLDIQSYVDGELSGWRARRAARRIEGDAAARALAAELQATKAFLAGNEVGRTLPEDPRFYWSRIQQAIGRGEQVQSRVVEMTWSWRRLFAPMAGVALAVLLAVVTLRVTPPALDESFRHLTEVENLSDEMLSTSFRSSSQNMFVVWVHEKAVAQAEAGFTDEEDFSEE